MKQELLEILRCPNTGKPLSIAGPGSPTGGVEEGELLTADDQHRYRIRKGIPRFVATSNYADSFGMQWEQFRQTQLDSYSGLSISADRFWKSTGWTAKDLQGQWALDVGCGAGRFAEIALGAGAKVVALDYSSAVDACYANLRHHPNLHVVQGDIYALPFELGSFSFVYSLGVLQHTPDVSKAFAALPLMLKEPGKLCVDYYRKSWKSLFHIKYFLRPITKRLPKPMLFNLLKTTVPVLLPVSRFVGRIPVLGAIVKRVLPVANYYGVVPLDDEQQYEWSLLDTFDWFSPTYDQPQTAATARRWMEEAGLNEIEVQSLGHLVARGCK